MRYTSPTQKLPKLNLQIFLKTAPTIYLKQCNAWAIKEMLKIVILWTHMFDDVLARHVGPELELQSCVSVVRRSLQVRKVEGEREGVRRERLQQKAVGPVERQSGRNVFVNDVKGCALKV